VHDSKPEINFILIQFNKKNRLVKKNFEVCLEERKVRLYSSVSDLSY